MLGDDGLVYKDTVVGHDFLEFRLGVMVQLNG